MANPPADALQGAITHDFQTEGYYIVSGSGTAFIDGKVVNGRRSTANPDGGPNGPGCGGGVAVGARKVELKVGDVLIVPPGVIHGYENRSLEPVYFQVMLGRARPEAMGYSDDRLFERREAHLR